VCRVETDYAGTKCDAVSVRQARVRRHYLASCDVPIHAWNKVKR